MKRDLVLESRSEERGEEDVEVILPNIQGQKYVFGPFYPGERVGEEFIFARNEKGLSDPTHRAIISVDDKGQYWIQNDTRTVEGMTTGGSVCKTFVNGERVKALEVRLIKSGDVISLGDPNSQAGPGRHPDFCVKERTLAGSFLESDSDNDKETGDALTTFASSPLANEVSTSVMTCAKSPLAINETLEKIMSYLPLEDLKSARLVCKQWKEEASKHLEKRGSVSFIFSHDYLNPEYSTRVFRYVHEMRDLKMRNIHVKIILCSGFDQNYTRFFSPGEPGHKLMDDLRKLLNSSHSFSTLFLLADIQEEPGFLPFATIFQDLGEKLVELKLEIFHLLIPARATLPPFPLMRNLKKLAGESFEEGELEPRWAPLLVPLFSNNLERFTSLNQPENYLEEFAKHPMPHLKEIELKQSASRRTISRLLELETPLTFLEIKYCKWCSESEELLEGLLLKHSPSLKTLVIRIGYCFVGRVIVEVKFPSFPKLQQLELDYGRTVRISWDADLDYGVHFSALRKLTVGPQERWSNDDPVFNAFFPEGGNLRCQTVEEVWIPVMPNDSFQPRMEQIRNMFPSAEKMNFFQ